MENNISLLELKIINESQSDADPYFKLKENGIESKIITTLNITNDPFIGNSNRVVFITIMDKKAGDYMYINQAVEQALKRNKGITRADSDMILFPTSSEFGCILVVPYASEDYKSSIRWNPNAEDLMSNDWEVL